MRKLLFGIMFFVLGVIIGLMIFISFVVITTPKEQPVLITGYVQGLGD